MRTVTDVLHALTRADVPAVLHRNALTSRYGRAVTGACRGLSRTANPATPAADNTERRCQTITRTTAECPDQFCERYGCMAYREGYADGNTAGWAGGYAAGLADGYTEGYADATADAASRSRAVTHADPHPARHRRRHWLGAVHARVAGRPMPPLPRQAHHPHPAAAQDPEVPSLPRDWPRLPARRCPGSPGRLVTAWRPHSPLDRRSAQQDGGTAMRGTWQTTGGAQRCWRRPGRDSRARAVHRGLGGRHRARRQFGC